MQPLTGRIYGYQPCEIAGLKVVYKEKYNDFGEDVGKIVAFNENGSTAPVRLSALIKSIGDDLNFKHDSIADKITLLEVLRKLAKHRKIEIILKKPFGPAPEGEESPSRRIAESVKHAVDYHVFHSESLVETVMPDHAIHAMRLNAISRIASLGNRELQLTAAFYDKIVEIFSYAQPGTEAVLTKNTFLQILPNGIPISPLIYAKQHPISPLNPQGDMTTTEEFSSFASLMFDTSGMAKGKKLEEVYAAIIHGASTSQKFDEKAVTVLEKVKEYLSTKMKDPFTEEERLTDSVAYAKYKQALAKHALSLAKYQAEKSNLDLTKLEDQRKWQVTSLSLQNQIDEAKNDLEVASTTAARAINYLKVYGNNAVQYVIGQAKDKFDNSAFQSQLTPGSKFHLSYGLPSNWYVDDSAFASVTFSTSNLSDSYSHESSQYGGGGSFGIGWLSVGGGISSTSEETRSHLTTSNVKFSFKLATIPIIRPWMDDTLFGLSAWNLGGQPKGKISGGLPPQHDPQLNDRMLPYYSTAFVIAKDVEITGNWSESDLRILKKSFQSSSSVGFGPFRLSGTYSHRSEKVDFTSSLSDGTFKIPGAQIIGVINTIVPFSAPDSSQ